MIIGGVIQGDTRSLDYGSQGQRQVPRLCSQIPCMIRVNKATRINPNMMLVSFRLLHYIVHRFVALYKCSFHSIVHLSLSI